MSVPPTQIESVPLAPASPLVATHVIADQKALRPKGVNTRMINRANYRDTAIIFLEKHFPTPMERLFKRFGEMGAMFIILLGVVGVAIVFGVVAGAVIMHFR